MALQARRSTALDPRALPCITRETIAFDANRNDWILARMYEQGRHRAENEERRFPRTAVLAETFGAALALGRNICADIPQARILNMYRWCHCGYPPLKEAHVTLAFGAVTLGASETSLTDADRAAAVRTETALQRFAPRVLFLFARTDEERNRQCNWLTRRVFPSLSRPTGGVPRASSSTVEPPCRIVFVRQAQRAADADRTALTRPSSPLSLTRRLTPPSPRTRHVRSLARLTVVHGYGCAFSPHEASDLIDRVRQACMPAWSTHDRFALLFRGVEFVFLRFGTLFFDPSTGEPTSMVGSWAVVTGPWQEIACIAPGFDMTRPSDASLVPSATERELFRDFFTYELQLPFLLPRLISVPIDRQLSAPTDKQPVSPPVPSLAATPTRPQEKVQDLDADANVSPSSWSLPCTSAAANCLRTLTAPRIDVLEEYEEEQAFGLPRSPLPPPL